MLTVDIHDAETNLSKLVEQAAARGEGFIIARAGKPLVKVVPLEQADRPQRRIGFMKGRIKVPDDWKKVGREEIETRFEGGA
jgi:prevent-host-death family protein